MQDVDLTGDAPSVADAVEDRVAPLVTDVATVEATLWVIVLASVALDVYTTYLGLAAGLTEGNPVMRWAIADFGFGSLVAAKIVVVGAAAALRAHRPRFGRTIALGLAIPWVVTVVANVAVLATL